MSVSLSNKAYGTVAIAGHVGCGHCHSLNLQVQDDSVGLSVVVSLFAEATGVTMKIKDVVCDKNKITVYLENGGVGTGYARRNISFHEKIIIKNIIGKQAINTHTLMLELFGRFYGQGVTETPVALQTAVANASLDGFAKNFPEHFTMVEENYAKNCGKILGAVLNISGVDVSVLGTVNATIGGIGPNEDLEGNSCLGDKGKIIKQLNMEKIPTLIIEAMIHSSFSEGLEENTYFVRADEQDDNPYVLQAALKACEELKYPILHHVGGMKRTPDALRNNTKKVGQSIIDLGQSISCSELAEEKVDLIAQLATVVSQDCGGISFMTNALHEQIGGAGMLRKTSAVLNLVVTDQYAEDRPIPFLTEKELKEYVDIAKQTMLFLNQDIYNATQYII